LFGRIAREIGKGTQILHAAERVLNRCASQVLITQYKYEAVANVRESGAIGRKCDRGDAAGDTRA
jgi:hypothetical protein